MSVLSRLLWRNTDEHLMIEPMRRRHLDDVLPIEQRSYPKPWTARVFQSELELARRTTATTWSQGPAARSSVMPA